MKKVSFFRSINVKFVIIYVLLILVAMQIIGVYFVRQLEETLRTNFQTSLKERVDLLAYNVVEEMEKQRIPDDPTLEEEIKKILRDFESVDISEVRVIEGRSRKILGTSDPSNQGVVGQRTTELLITQSLNLEEDQSNIRIDPHNGHRIWVLSTPMMSGEKVIGAIYLVAKIENVFTQMKTINGIFATGTAIALSITAILGILLAQTITKPISDMKKQAIAMAKGNFSRKVRVYGQDEIGT
jgi:two-component system sensor histidine kinase VicK